MTLRKKLIAAAGLGAIAIGGSMALSTLFSGKVLNGVSVGGVDLGGLTERQAAEKVRVASKSAATRTIAVTVGKQLVTLRPADMGVVMDLSATSAAALRAGRSNPIKWLGHTTGLLTTDLTYVSTIDEEALASVLARLQRIAPLSHSARKVLLQAAVSGAQFKRVPTAADARPWIKADLRAAEKRESALLTGAVKFAFEGNTIELSSSALKTALTLREISDADTTWHPHQILSLDLDRLTVAIVDEHPALQRAPVDATFKVSGDTASVVAGKHGARLQARSALDVFAYREGAEIVQLASTAVLPSLTTEVAETLGISRRISTFTTTFDPRNAPRVGNIDKMASSIDGVVLRPGESFSLNGATGPRTVANGYQEAGIIVDGELVPGIGGGVCQVATTVFNAVFSAGLEIDERVNHSLYISKYPTGRDATVNYGFQDLRFTNDTSFGLLLTAVVNAKSLTISIYSSPLDRTVTQTVSERSNPREPQLKYVDDPTLPGGNEVIVEPGIFGFDVTVTRTVTKDGTVIHDDKFVSKYRPWKRIVRRGTGPAPSPSPTR